MVSDQRQDTPRRKKTIAQGASGTQKFAILGFGIIALLIILAGWWTFDAQKFDIRRERLDQLSAIATLKAQQITEWRTEKLKDAEVLRNNRILARQVADWIANGQPRDSIHNKLLTRLNDLLTAHGYHALVLLDGSARQLLSVGESYALDAHGRDMALAAFASGRSLFADIYSRHELDHDHRDGQPYDHDHNRSVNLDHEHDNHVHLDLHIPLLVANDEQLETVAVIIIRMEPKKFLFPLVESWPIQRKTAETVLLKPSENGVIRLSSRRHLPENALREIKPPEERMTPPKMVHARQEGMIEHLDYRNVPVISVVKRVASSPWYLVAKVDQAEIFAPIYKLARQVTILVVAFILLAGITVFYWWRQLRASYLAEHYQEKLDKQLLEQRFHALSKHANDLILLIDQQGRIVEVNERATEIFGYRREQMIGMNFVSLRREQDFENVENQRKQLLADGALIYEALFVKQDGSTFPAENSARIIELQGKKYFQGILRDITERKKAEEQIQYLAHHDALTGLPNRNLLQDRLTLNLARAKRNNSKSAILFLDFDRFKNINDSLGHSVGDGVLKEVSSRLNSCLRTEDTVARVGGDEFIILLSDLSDGKFAAHVAQKVMEMGTRPYQVEGQKFRLTISIGISIYPDDGEDIETLLKNADSAMYHAKKAGRDTYYFYTEDMNAKTLEALNLENDLQQALVNREFELYYQPQVDLASNQIVGAEALLRWKHPQHGHMSPAVFIPIAEERGLIVPIGDWVLETACCQSVAWQQQGLPTISMAVNISALQLQHADFYEKLAAVLQRTGLAPQLLELELTESAVMQGGEQASFLLQQLKALGVRLAMDDFGTGYSSLSYLKRFPIDKLKIDRSFIKDLSHNSEDEALTQAIIGIGRSLKHKVIAEGVETQEQRQFLQREGCNEMQGFLFSRPLPAEQFAELLRTSTQAKIAASL